MRKDYLFFLTALILMFVKSTSSIVNTIVYSAAVIPLAFLLGEFTAQISEYIGDKKGGLLAATIGNMPELMMGIWAIRYGMLAMAKSALIGSIISNMLLVLGISIFFGGIKYREQSFNKIIARTNFNMLLLAMSAMIVMASLNRYGTLPAEKLVSISLKVSLVLIIVYVAGLVFSLHTHSNLFLLSEKEEEIEKKDAKKLRRISLWLISSSIILFIISEKLIVNIKNLVEQYSISQEFLGIILVPLLGNIGENLSAIVCAAKNKVNLSLEIAIGSGIQISLLVTPLLILVSYMMGINMDFLFSNFQITICAVAIGMSYFVFQDGKTYWFEGAILIAIYVMITIAYYYVS
jgi:Ca2+:H+ antiporter